METQTASGPVENICLKILPIIVRGILGGTAGGVVVGMTFSGIHGLFQTFYYAQVYSSSPLSYLIPDLLSDFVHGTIRDGTEVGLPIGLVIGLSTGILAALFGRHSPGLLVWLALSGIGVVTGCWFALLRFPDWLILLTIIFVSLAASWMAYKLTLQRIKKSVANKASQAYTILASLSYLLLIFIMSYGFVSLLAGRD